MNQIIVVLFLFISMTLISYAENITTVPTYRYNFTPMHKNHNSYNNSIIQKNNLSALEEYALKKSYPHNNDISRLERLEELAFGSIQSGDINLRYNSVENAILSRPQNSYYNKNSIINRLSNYFGGQTTGFTPNIIPNMTEFNHNMFGQNYRNFNQYSNNFFNNGFKYYDNINSSYNTVKILD